MIVRTAAWFMFSRGLILMAAWAGLSILPHAARATEAGAALPKWLSARLTQYEFMPVQTAPSSLWRISHRGAPAYFVVAPCCDQFNPLFDAQGKQLCSPTGGVHGLGDGRCPFPADPHTAIKLIWVHPKSPVQSPTTPALTHS